MTDQSANRGNSTVEYPPAMESVDPVDRFLANLELRGVDPNIAVLLGRRFHAIVSRKEAKYGFRQ